MMDEAKKYQSRTAFCKGDQAAYAYLWKRGLLDEACAHMPISPRFSYKKWTREAVLDEAAKYGKRSEFKRGCAGAYEHALANGYLDQACAHMRDGAYFWHVFELMAVAVKYRHWGEFIKAERQAYNFANRFKLLSMASAHMEKFRKSWDRPSAMAEAAKHQSRGLFQAAASGAYKHAVQYGYLDEACAHMPPPEYGFSKERAAVLYHLRITGPGGLVLFKVGITNRAVEDRIAGMGLHDGISAEVLDRIEFASGRDARIAEKRLHRRLSSKRYSGPPVMKNGNTELFTVNVLDF